MNKEKRAEIFRRFKLANPQPRTELAYETPFELLIAVMLSAQATDVSVNKATARLFPIANTPQGLLDLGVDGITPFIRTIGLFNAKARNVIDTCRILCEQHDSSVPNTRESLEALPGVGRKTANVVLNTAFGQPAMAVDTHIFRVANRTGIATGKNVLEVERRLLRLVPAEYLLNAHHWLLLHGRYVCQARKPDCPNCLISDLCEFRTKTPVPGKPDGQSAKASRTAGDDTPGGPPRRDSDGNTAGKGAREDAGKSGKGTSSRTRLRARRTAAGHSASGKNGNA